MTDAEEDVVLALNKCVEGPIQAARLYHKKAFEVLHKIGFNGGEVDQCLFWKQYERDSFLWQYTWMTTQLWAILR